MAGFPSLEALNRKLVRCRKCPRLAAYLDAIKAEHPDWWCRPAPGFGDWRARILLVGLAPGRAGSNRTGRMFTGDASGEFLYPVLHEVGLANQAQATSVGDGLRLKGAYITAVVRCCPPHNKPRREEIGNCLPWTAAELKLLRQVRVVVALGRIAHDGFLRIVRMRASELQFRHGAVHQLPADRCSPVEARYLLDTYHPSRQNTNTGRLTREMLMEVFRKAVELAKESGRPQVDHGNLEPGGGI